MADGTETLPFGERIEQAIGLLEEIEAGPCGNSAKLPLHVPRVLSAVRRPDPEWVAAMQERHHSLKERFEIVSRDLVRYAVRSSRNGRLGTEARRSGISRSI